MIAPVARRVFVHGIDTRARIGLLAAELGRTQPLSIDIDVTIARDAHDFDDAVAEVDYRDLVGIVATVADGGHIPLIETFAQRVADGCAGLSELVQRVVVTVRKPGALAPAMAGVTVELAR